MLLDFLSSPETCFLVLLIKQLHLVVNDWTGFCHACHRYSARTTQGDKHQSETSETGKDLQEDLRSDRRMSCDTHEGFHRESRTSFAAEYEEGIENPNASVNINNDRVQVTTLVNYSESEGDSDGDCDQTSDDYDCHHASHDGEGINEDVDRNSCDCDAKDQLSICRLYHLDDAEVASEFHTSCCKTEQMESTLYNGSYTTKTSVKGRPVFTHDSITKETNKRSKIDGIESYDPGTDLEHQMNSSKNSVDCNSVDCKHESGNSVDRKHESGNSVDCKHESGNSVDCKHESGNSVDCKHESGNSVDCKHESGNSVDCKHESGNSVDCKHESGNSVDCKHESGNSVDCKHESGNSVDCKHESGNSVDCKHESGNSVDCKHESGNSVDCTHESGNSVDCKHESGNSVDCKHESGNSVDCKHESGNSVDCKHESGNSVDCKHESGNSVDCKQDSGNSVDCKPDSGNTVVGTGPSSDCLDRTMAVLIRLRLKVERLKDQSLFPYNPTPLLRLLYMCEQLYENLTHVE